MVGERYPKPGAGDVELVGSGKGLDNRLCSYHKRVVTGSVFRRRNFGGGK
jgi:hypothetical protein